MTPQSPKYFAHVDGLRALAVLAVLLYHLYPAALPGGFVGVDVFFVISGFVVTASLAGHESEGVGAFLGRFYARRLARLAPALATMLVATTLAYVLFVPRAWFNRAADATGLAAFWGLSNWVLDRQVVNYFDPGTEFNPFTHTWSLGVEEQFYLLAPLFLFVALGHQFSTRRRQIAAVGIALLATASLAACDYLGLTRGSGYVFYQITFRFWELAAGVLLYLGGTQVVALPALGLRLYGLSGWLGLLLVVLALGLPHPDAYPYLRSFIGVAGAVLLIGLPFMSRRDRVRPIFDNPLALWIGLRSYSLYLWHWPVYVLARWTTGLEIWPFNAVAVTLTLAAATASYRFIESPVRQSAVLRRQHPLVRIGSILLLLAAGWWTSATLQWHQPGLGLGQPTRHAADWYQEGELLKTTLANLRQCEPLAQYAAIGTVADAQRTFVPQGCKRRVGAQLFVIGDSHATALLPMLEQLSAEQGRVVKVLQVPGCGYVNLLAPQDEAHDARCHHVAQDEMHAVLMQARAGDVVFLPSLRLPRLVEVNGNRRAAPSDSGDDIYAWTPAELASSAVAARDAPRWITPFLAAGLKVVFEMPTPVLRSNPFKCVDWFNRGNPACSSGLLERRADQERYRAPVVKAIRDLTRRYSGVSAWDPLPALCDGSVCDALHRNRPLLFDGDHLSPYGNLRLLPSFRDYLSELRVGSRWPSESRS